MKQKVERAIRLIQAAAKIAHDNNSPLEIAYSGGKDSDVILELAKMSGVEFRAMYKNTTIDPPGTIAHAKSKGVEIVRPTTTFGKLIAAHGFPSRWARFCCSELKEYKIFDYAVLGIRRDESSKRAARYHEPELCRVYRGGQKSRHYYPLLDWTAQDVAEFVKTYNVQCHPLYYDENGTFHPERRLGCMCCPLASSRKRIEEFRKHPNMVKLYVRYGQQWLDRHPNVKSHENFDNAFEMFVGTLFFESKAAFQSAKNGLFGTIDCKEILEREFKIKF